MISLQKLEKFYQNISINLGNYLQEAVIKVDFALLKSLHLIHPAKEKQKNPHISFYFHILEDHEKITLFNQQFVIWIIPKMLLDTPTTLTIISLVHKKEIKVEMAFSTSGFYNTPKCLLKVLNHYLLEVIENEEAISSIT